MKNIKVNIVSIDRQDAIGIVDKNILKNFKRKNLDYNNIKLQNLSGNILSKLFIILFNFIRLIKLKNENSIINFTSSKNIFCHINILIKYRKSILTVHHVKNKLNFHIFGLNYKRLYKSFDRIITISQKTKEDLKAIYRIPDNKIDVIYNGCDLNIFRKIKSKLPIDYDYILHIGRENKRKNIQNILKAFKIIKYNFPHLKLLKIGEDKNNRSQTIKIIKKLGLTDDVIFKGFIKTKSLPKYYSNARLLIFPSIKEGFGLPIIEAMACGCPVVTSNIAPMTELVGRTQYLVNPYDEKNIAYGVIEVLSNKRLRNRMIENGIRRAQGFSWESSVNKIIGSYKNLWS